MTAQWGDAPHRQAAWARAKAIDLACLVRDEDPDDVSVWLGEQTEGDPSRWQALAVMLAAMVPVDRSVSELLAWVENGEVPRRLRVITKPQKPAPRGEQVCGLPNWHASHSRHVSRKETCQECLEGEREYQRNRVGKRPGERAKVA